MTVLSVWAMTVFRSDHDGFMGSGPSPSQGRA
jgi:hypothetical protein